MEYRNYEYLREICTFVGWYEECVHKPDGDIAGHLVLLECHRI